MRQFQFVKTAENTGGDVRHGFGIKQLQTGDEISGDNTPFVDG